MSSIIHSRLQSYIEEIEELLDHALGIAGLGHGHRIRHR